MRRFALLLLAVFTASCWAAAVEAQTIREIQDAIAAAGANWTAGENEAWDRFAAGGWGPNDAGYPLLDGTENYFQPLGLKDLPATLDWRNYNGKNYITPIKDQGNCGACWAFATTGPIESHIAIAENLSDPKLNLSEQDLLSCCQLPGCRNGCTGGFTTSSFDYARDDGLFDGACLPYLAIDTIPCDNRCADWQKRIYKIDSWALVGPGLQGVFPTPQEIIEALQHGPVGTSMIIYKDFYSYTGGIYQTVIGAPQGMHAVTIIGYDSDQEYWICKNSWGAAWGENGFFQIKWGAGEIGMLTILPVYTDQGPTGDDDDNDDNDDNDEDSTPDAPHHGEGTSHTTTTGCGG
jgi:C1A family cysteine protease